MAEERNVVVGRIQALMDDIDNWCPTPPRRPFPPRPRGLRDLLVATAIGELTALVSNDDIRTQMQDHVANLIVQAQQEIGRSG
jgi:hypothetical protein